MKINLYLASLILASSITITSQAATISAWTFETSQPGGASGITATTITGILPEIGIGSASGVHASGSTVYSNPTGNGTAESFSSNNWAVGDYYQFSAATNGYENITLNWAQTSSGTGPGEFKLAYQVNGGGFSDFFNYTVLPNQATAPGLGNWNATTVISGYNFSADLSALASLDQAAAVDFRLIMRTTADATPPGTVAAAGTSRVDSFTISGTAIPEPSGALLGGLGFICLLRRRRN